MPTTRLCIFVILLVGVYSVPGLAHGQDGNTVDQQFRAERLTTVEEAPLASKRMACLLRAGKRDPQELARAWEQAASDVRRALEEAQKTDKDVAPILAEELLAAARLLLDARLAVASATEDRRAALDIYRSQVEQMEQRNLLWAEAGIGGTTRAGYLAAHAEALLAAKRFAQESVGRSAGLAFLPRTEFIEDPLGSKEAERRRRETLTNTQRPSALSVRDSESEASPFHSKDIARQRVEMRALEPRTAAIRSRQALMDAQQDMQKRWAAGTLRNGVMQCFAPIQRCLYVELFLAIDRNERIAAFRRALERIAVIEDITERFVEWGVRSCTYSDLFEARAQRLRLEYQLAREREP